MERYEIKVKYEQIKKLMNFEQYREAMEIANTIDWDRSKNINMLCLVGEVYERCGFFEDSKAIYLRAYRLQPQSRIVIYRLAELSIKLRDYEDSIHFYKEYQEIAPYDVNLYVLRYKIYQARGSAPETLISILEELKEADYHERWAYELAKLYSQAGMIDKCVAECDEINLWFGSGRYVKKALQLKKQYQPLTKEQQQKLDETAPEPHKAQETISQRSEAEQKRLKAQEEFASLRQQEEARQKERDLERETFVRRHGGGDQKEDSQLERARQTALNAAREAKAAQLLQEAAEEEAAEDAVAEEREDGAFIGQETFPELIVKVPRELKAPKLEAPEIKMPERKAAASRAAASETEAEEAAVLRATAEETEAAEEAAVLRASAAETAEAEEAAVLQAAASETEAEEAAASQASAEETESAEKAAALQETASETGAQEVSGGRERSGKNLIYGNEPTESDILAENIAMILGGRRPKVRAQKQYEDDFIRTSPVDEFINEDLSEERAFIGDVDNLDIRAREEEDETDGYEPEYEDDVKEKEPEYEFDDDYERENPPEDDTTPEDEESFEKKESAFRRMFRMNSGTKSRRSKGVTVIAREPDYDVQIRPVIVSRYDTINLQKELAKSIRAIMNATEKEEVEKTMETINKSMEESNIPKLIQTKRLNIQQVQEAMEQEEKEESSTPLADEAEIIDGKMQRLLGEEYDGQMRMMIEEQKQVEKQITGQMRIEDLLQAEEQKQLIEVKKKALEQAEEYIDQLSVVVPYISEREEVTIEPEELSTQQILEKAQTLMGSKLESKADLENMISQLSELLTQTDVESEAEAEAAAAKAEPEEAEVQEELKTAVVEEIAVEEAAATAEEEKPEAETEALDEESLAEEPESESAEVEDVAEAEEAEIQETEAEAEAEAEEIEAEAEPEESEVQEEPEVQEELEVEETEAQETETEAEVEPEEAEVQEELKTAVVEEMAMEEAAATAEEEKPESETDEAETEAFDEEPLAEEPESEPAEAEDVAETEEAEAQETEAETETEAEETETQEEPEDTEVQEEPEEAPEESQTENRNGIDEEQKRILSYFMKFSGVEDQITDFLQREKDNGESFVITGAPGTGRASLALRLMKTITKADANVSRKIAKLPAGTLNNKPIDVVFAKVEEGALLIERAEDLKEESCEKLAQLLDAYARKVRVILIGETEPVAELLEKHKNLADHFAYRFQLHSYNNNELVEFAKAYAETKGYTIDEMGILALYTKLAGAKKNREAVMLGDVKEIINRAITVNEKKKGVRSFFENLLMKNVDDNGNILLRESDFEVK